MQVLTVAPQHLQPQFWNSGWIMATLDGKTAGLVPVNYIKIIKPNTKVEEVKKDEKKEGSSLDMKNEEVQSS